MLNCSQKYFGFVMCALLAACALPTLAQEAVPSPPAARSQTDVAILPGDYVLAPDDQVEITVEGHSEFDDKTATVLPDGTFAYLGRHYHAAGSTIDGLRQQIVVGLKRQLRYPVVNVTVPQAHLRQVSIVGKVHSPGQFPFKPGMTLIDAIAVCGGPAQEPEMSDVTLWTNNASTPEPVDLVKLMSGQDPALNVPLQPGDVLSVQARNPATAMVLIQGQVLKPGQYPVRPEGATIMAMLTQAGGLGPNGAITRVQVTHDGRTQLLNLRPTLFDSTAPVGQTPITAGDVVNVPLNNAKIAVLGEVNTRNVYPLPDGEPMTVTRAMAMAGGPTNDADMKNVQIIRPGPTGGLQYIAVNVDKILQNKNGVNPDLQDGDILYFPKRGHGNTQGSTNDLLGGIFTFGTLSRLLRGGF